MLITDDLEKLLVILPSFVRDPLKAHSKKNLLIEVVMDLGRRPEARFPEGPEYLSEETIKWQDIEFLVKKVGNFTGDNRAGIERTLHRISSIRNRFGNTVGLTCRVGRAIFGTITNIRDLLETGQSILLLGRPGVGKTTAIREIARVLSVEMEKRVVIVDTSNEIAGDGDIPHPAIGRARRMQVAQPELQHKVMIESIENHMPEVIIIDEISTELEALAARTIAERGVQLVGTAHGNSLNNLIKNPTLSDLIGGIEYVTLSDHEAIRRGTQKSILERRAAPCFEKTIEIQNRKSWIVHESTEKSVDKLLQGYSPLTQKRDFAQKHYLKITRETSEKKSEKKRKQSLRLTVQKDRIDLALLKTNKEYSLAVEKFETKTWDNTKPLDHTLSLYIFGINTQQINLIIKRLKLPIKITKELPKSDIILAKHVNLKQNKKLRQYAKVKEITIHTVQTNTLPQITRALRHMLNLGI